MEHSEEKYLWFFTYYLHGKSRLWWTYFAHREEALAFREQISGWLPCLESCQVEELPRGLRVMQEYYHHRCSSQMQADALRKHELGWRKRWLFPLAPLACDWQTSFIKGLGTFTSCGRCNQLLPTSAPLLVRESIRQTVS